MERLEKLIVKNAVEDELSKSILSLNGNFRVDKEELIQELSNHEKLYKKSYKEKNRIVVTCVWEITKEWLENDPQILIIPYPIFAFRYDGWQIVTDKTTINELIIQITEERQRKNLRRLRNLLEKIDIERNAVIKKKILPKSKIKQIEKEELRPIKLLSYSFMEEKPKKNNV